MPQSPVEQKLNNFSKGFITEASSLSFPEGASVDELNFELLKDGSRRRRLGLDLEPDYKWNKGSDDITSDAIATYRWDNVGGDPTMSVAVVQVGEYLWVYDLYTDSTSANLLNNGLPISSIHPTTGVESFEATGTPEVPMQFASVNDYLVFANGVWNPRYVYYDKPTKRFYHVHINMFIRDLFGVDDGLDLIERPSILTGLHKYNLKNQGWPDEFFCGESNGFVDPIQHFKDYPVPKDWKGDLPSDAYKYPSNADLFTYGVALASDAKNGERFYPKKVFDAVSGATRPPLGRYIINPFKRSNSRKVKSGIDSLPNDTEYGRPSTVASLGNRVFYAGVLSELEGGDDNSPSMNGMVFFTKVVNSKSDLGICYQEADPTSRQVSDLVDTDGGHIQISECTYIHKLVPFKDSIIVLADNGIWRIFGGDKGFLATEYQVSKISDVGCVNSQGVVVAADLITYWSKGGIYAVTGNELESMGVQSLSQNTIQTYVNNLSGLQKKSVVGVYDVAQKQISWLFSSSPSTLYPYQFDTELVFDVVLGAFTKNEYKYKYPDGYWKNNIPNFYVAGYITTPNYVLDNYNTYVYQEDGTPLVVNEKQVAILSDTRGGTTFSKKKYVIIKGNELTFGYKYRDSFRDFQTYLKGVNYDSYLLTGHNNFGDFARHKFGSYIYTYFNRTEDGFIDSSGTYITHPSGCDLQTRWDYSDSGSSGKWGMKINAYRLLRPYVPTGADDSFDYGYQIIATKNKILGSGKALAIKIQSQEGKDLHIIGWQLTGSINTVP